MHHPDITPKHSACDKAPVVYVLESDADLITDRNPSSPDYGRELDEFVTRPLGDARPENNSLVQLSKNTALSCNASINRLRIGLRLRLLATLCLSFPVTAQETEDSKKVSPPPPEAISPLLVEPGIIPFAPTTEPGITPLDGAPDTVALGDIPNLGEPIPPIAPMVPAPLLADETLIETEKVEEDAASDSNSLSMIEAFDAMSGRTPGIPSGNFGGGNRGFESFLPAAVFGGASSSRRLGFTASVNLMGSYDSNPSRGFGGVGVAGAEGDFFTTLGGSIGLRRTAQTLSYGFNYTGGYNIFANNPDLGGYNQTAGAFINHIDGPLEVGLIVGLNYGSGANRLYADAVEEIAYNLSLNARYRISPKTSITGNFTTGFTNASTDQDTESTDFNLAALWRYSSRTEFGPGIRYSARSGNVGDELTTIGPTLNANYRLSGKVSLAAIIGASFVQSDNEGSDDLSRFTSLSLNYRASSLWGMNLTYLSDAQASFVAAGLFENVNSLRLGYNRRIRRATWQLGTSLESRSTQNSDTVNAPNIQDRNFISFDTSLGMQVFSENTNANIFFRYNKQDGSPADTFDAFQVGLGISHAF